METPAQCRFVVDLELLDFANELVGLGLQGFPDRAPPRSSTMTLKPPATLRPGIGEAPTTTTLASLICSAHCLRSSLHDGVGRADSGRWRSSNGLRMIRNEPKLGPLACSTKEMPHRPIVWATPGRCG